jgi:hypothetical protein
LESKEWYISNHTNLFDTERNETKRVILKAIASVFDPLGLFTPVLLKGKVLLRKLWSWKADWDAPVIHDDINIFTIWNGKTFKIPNQ